MFVKRATEVLPFETTPRCRKVLRDADTALLRAELRHLGCATDFRVESPHVLGLLRLRAVGVCDVSRPLTSATRHQLAYYRAHKVPIDQLWSFSVESASRLRTPIRADLCCTRRAGKCFDLLATDMTRELQADLEPPAHDASPRLCCVVPRAFANLILHGHWKDLLLPSPWAPGHWGMSSRFKNHPACQCLRALHLSAVAPVVLEPLRAAPAFHMGMAVDFANDLRALIQHNDLPPDAMDTLLSWICRFHVAMEVQDVREYPRLSSPEERCAGLVRLLQVSDLLRSDESLPSVIHRCCAAVLSPPLLASMQAEIKGASASAASIRRFRLSMDIGFMMFHRCCNHRGRSRHGPKVCRFLLWDSSPQFHRDYELAVSETLLLPTSNALHEAVLSLGCHWRTRCDALARDGQQGLQGELHVEKDEIVEDAANMDRVREAMTSHSLPATLVGFGAATFAHKLHSLLHAIRLEEFDDMGVQAWVEELFSTCSDAGVESALPSAAAVQVGDFCPDFRDTAEVHRAKVLELVSPMPWQQPVPDLGLDRPLAHPRVVEPAEVFEEAPGPEDHDEGVPAAPPGPGVESFEEAPLRPTANFKHVFGVKGLHHLTHNATMTLQLMPTYARWLPGASNICKLVGRLDLRTKMIQRCYHSDMGRAVANAFAHFSGHIHPGRWATLAYSVPQLIAIQHALCWGWDLQTFLGTDHEEDLGGGANDPLDAAPELQQPQPPEVGGRSVVQSADLAIRSPAFWGWLHMMEAFCETLRKACGVWGFSQEK